MDQATILKEARRRARLTQEHLADAAGVSTRTVMRAEKGEPISDEAMMALCAVLGLDAAAVPRPERGGAAEELAETAACAPLTAPAAAQEAAGQETAALGTPVQRFRRVWGVSRVSGERVGARLGLSGLVGVLGLAFSVGFGGCWLASLADPDMKAVTDTMNDATRDVGEMVTLRIIESAAAALDAAPVGQPPQVVISTRQGITVEALRVPGDEWDEELTPFWQPTWTADHFLSGEFADGLVGWMRSPSRETIRPQYTEPRIQRASGDAVWLSFNMLHSSVCEGVMRWLPMAMTDRVQFAVTRSEGWPDQERWRRVRGQPGTRSVAACGDAALVHLHVLVARSGVAVDLASVAPARS